MKKIVPIILLILCLGSIGGCKESKVKSYNGFIYFINTDANKVKYAWVYALTEEAQELEEITVPSTIEGYGVRLQTRPEWGQGYMKGLLSINLKIININQDITVDRHTLNGINNLEKVVINSIKPMTRFIDITSDPLLYEDVKVYLPFDNFEYLKEQLNFKEVINVVKSRALFYYNYIDAPNSGLYYTSHDDEGELISKPVDPTRDGYTFTGWYLESSCDNQFDFDNIDNSNISDLKLYAKWESSQQ